MKNRKKPKHRSKKFYAKRAKKREVKKILADFGVTRRIVFRREPQEVQKIEYSGLFGFVTWLVL